VQCVRPGWFELHLPENVLTQVLPDQWAKALLAILQSRSTPRSVRKRADGGPGQGREVAKLDLREQNRLGRISL
jgi:hypothetical protein